MDTRKTGQLIAARRKELGLTQKQLAGQLNVSDRAVSKWERGAGFPDIALLEPLADVLGRTVLTRLFFAAVTGLLMFMLLDIAGAFDRPVELTVPVGIYVNGELAEESSVRISGMRDVLNNDSFDGVLPLSI